jgi:hypothetical protein
MLYIAGHGLSSTPAVWGCQADDPNHPLGIYSDPTTIDKAFVPDDIGTSWDNGVLEWLILAVCSQVRVGGDDPWSNDPAANDNGVLWIKKMDKVHALLGYRDAAPGNGTDVNVAGDFVERLEPGGNHDEVHIAWCLANRDRHAWNATALVNVNNLTDKTWTVGVFPTPDNPGTSYRFFWWRNEGTLFDDWHLRYKTFTLP